MGLKDVSMDIFLVPLRLFAFNPAAAFVVAAIFGVASLTRLFTRWAKIISAVVAFVWTIYGGWEVYMTTWRSETGDMAIRVDLVLFGPYLLAIALIGIVALIIGWKRRAKE
jgi:hypothetical protein